MPGKAIGAYHRAVSIRRGMPLSVTTAVRYPTWYDQIDFGGAGRYHDATKSCPTIFRIFKRSALIL